VTFTKHFTTAVEDYLFLLERCYPQKTILKMVGDRYALSGVERTMLFRGVTTRVTALERKEKLAACHELTGNLLHLDGINILLTLGSYLNGSMVFIGTDGVLRDASEVHGKVFRTDLLNRASGLLAGFLATIRPAETRVYVDSPAATARSAAKALLQNLQEHELAFTIIEDVSPDHLIKKAETGFIATSDSMIIDIARVKTCDLARQCLEHHFSPEFTDLRKFLSG
jgi:hypothetical protein